MPFTTWIRDLFGIRKDYVDTEKAVLEIEKLEAEKRERDLITPATLDDVKAFDPKLKQILEEVRKRREGGGGGGIGSSVDSGFTEAMLIYLWSYKRKLLIVTIVLSVIIGVGIYYLLLRVLLWLLG